MKFWEEGDDKERLFANELKPYILIGLFQEWETAPEEVINFNLLQ
jgi:hypothetical protein